MALPTFSDIELLPQFQALRTILVAAEKLATYESQSADQLAAGTMDTQRANTYLRTMQSVRDRLAQTDPTEAAGVLAVLMPKADDLVAKHAEILEGIEARILQLDEFLEVAGLKVRPLLASEAEELRLKLEGAQARSVRR